MSIVIESTTDTPEAVTAAMGDLAGKKVEEKKPVEKPSTDPVVDAPTDKISDEIVDEGEVEEPTEVIEEEDEDTEVVEAKEDDAKPKKKGGFQKKIERQDKKISALEQEREYWRQEALRTKAPETKQEAKPDFSNKPDPGKYNTVAEYDDAVFDWKYEQKRSKEIAKEREAKVKNEVQTKISKHDVRVEEFKKSHDDFREVWEEAVEMVGAQNLSLTVREAIINSDSGPALMYELANDPKEFKRICELTPISAAMALGKIEARLSKPTTSLEKTKKTVPKPVTPVRSKGSKILKDINDPNLSQRDYEALRNEQIRQRREGRV